MRKFKSMRQVMKEKGVLKDYLKNHKYDPASKYFNNFAIDHEVLDNYLDVSMSLIGRKNDKNGAETRK